MSRQRAAGLVTATVALPPAAASVRDGRRFVMGVLEAWGLGDQQGKTLGVAFADVNGDGFPDLYLANDEVPGLLPERRLVRPRPPWSWATP